MTDTAVFHPQDDTPHTHQVLSCDGGKGALGHPKVFLEFNHGRAVCPYCGKVFAENAGTGAKA